jgi:uncharacterized membrane protein HdeD (DUF308 family)
LVKIHRELSGRIVNLLLRNDLDGGGESMKTGLQIFGLALIIIGGLIFKWAIAVVWASFAILLGIAIATLGVMGIIYSFWMSDR